jgi:modification methylase
MPRTKKTATASFGSPGRAGHDASAFYAARLYADQPQMDSAQYVENPIAADKLDTIIHGSSEDMKELPDSSVHLMVTSPPYNVGKDYDEDMTLGEYLGVLKKVWTEVYRVLVPASTWQTSGANRTFHCTHTSSKTCSNWAF